MVAKGEGVGGWSGSLGLAVANCYLWNGWTMGSYCMAQGTMVSILGQTIIEKNIAKRMYI